MARLTIDHDMDFFSSVGQHPTEFAPDGFAKAVNERFTPQLIPPSAFPTQPPPHLPPAPQPSPPSASPPLPVPPADLQSFLARPSILILDIRSHHAYATARISGAISLSAPSTLLKRPLFSTQRLTSMLSSTLARQKFSAWADHESIIVYDADTALIKSPCNISGLLQKFRNEGFSGTLAYVSGGFQAVWKERRDLVITTAPQDEEDDDETPRSSLPGQLFDMPTPSNSKRSPALRTKRLPPSAFSAASTTIPMRSPSCTLPQNTAYLHSAMASNPFFDSIRQNVELSQGITERIPLRLPQRVRRRLHDLPFNWLRNIAQHAGPSLNSPPQAEESGQETDGSIQYPEEMSQSTQDEGTEALAVQFYKIELSEQRRLQAVMNHHSKESGLSEGMQPPSEFPYSIAAGVEKGTKNRYRHIWPFEHARVRLQSTSPSSTDQDDYVNASYVQPLCTRKRYIATQGPLDATFIDFWTLVWQQNVHVIVMLTREIEGSMIKCGRYWLDGTYGPLSLQLVSESGDMEHEREKDVSGSRSTFFSEFATQTRQPQKHLPKHNRTIKRKFILRHSKFPHAGARKIVQLQYLGWPDMTVPDDPRGILQLIKDTDAAVEESSVGEIPRFSGHPSDSERLDPETGVRGMALSNPPILLHCSAGVGRTGGFIAVDAILDAMRREYRQSSPSNGTDASGYVSKPETDAMDVDTLLPDSSLGSSLDCDTSDTKTRQWVERVSEMAENETPLNPNKPMPATRPPTLPNSLQPSQPSNDQPRSFPLTLPNGIFRAKQRSELSDISTAQTHERLRAFSTPTSGISGFALSHRPSLLNTAPILPDSPTASSASISHILPPNFSCGTGPSPLVSSISSSTGEALESSSSDFSALSSRSVSPSAQVNLTLPILTSLEPITNHFKDLRPPRIEASISLPELRLSRTEETTPLGKLADGSSPGSLDYTLPRKLHLPAQEPSNLTSFEDPVMSVLLDMREQRMSLCQSLRQYVFVHAAVVEGALQIVDEERKKSSGTSNGTTSSRRAHRKGSAQQLSSSPSAASTMGTTSTGKRVASPTELPKEDKEGGVRLAKRPSVKRKSDKDEKYPLNLQLPDASSPRTSQASLPLSSLREGYSGP